MLYRDFTEGVLYLIKRQGEKGVEILSTLMSTLEEHIRGDTEGL